MYFERTAFFKQIDFLKNHSERTSAFKKEKHRGFIEFLSKTNKQEFICSHQVIIVVISNKLDIRKINECVVSEGFQQLAEVSLNEIISKCG